MARYQNHPAVRYSDLRELYHDAADRFGDKPLFFQKRDHAYRSKSFRQFADDVDALGTELCARGLCGKTVLLAGRNGCEWATAYMAVICGGGRIVPVKYEIDADALASLAKRVNADAVIHSLPEQRLAGLDRSLPLLSFDDLERLIRRGKARLASGDRSFLDTKFETDAVSAILFSSSAADARGVMLSHRNLCFNLYETSRMVRIDERDVLLSVMPLHYSVQTLCGFLWPLSRGATVVFGEGLRHLSRNLREAQPTVLIGVPLLFETVYRNINRHIRREGMEKRVQNAIRISNAIPNPDARQETKKRLFSNILKSLGGRLRLLISVGAHTDPNVLKGWRELGVTAIQGYEMAECTALTAINRDTFFNDYSAGMASPDTILDVFDMNDDGVGEIRFRGESVMLGYYDRPDLSKTVLRDGWLYTGDVGCIDEDGLLYLLGKKKNAIPGTSGEKIFPEELEARLIGSPLVKEAVVLGKPNPSRNRIDLIAVIHPDDGELLRRFGTFPSQAELDSELRRLISTVNGTLPAHKRIRAFRVSHEPFPKTVSGIIRRAKVSGLFK